MSDAADNTTAPAETPEMRETLLGGPQKKALLVGVAGLIAFGVLGGILTGAGQAEVKQFFLSYLIAFMFWVSIGLGSVFFLLIQYVTGGRWGILLRRPLEANSRTLMILGVVLFIPVAIAMAAGKNSIYWWGAHGHDDAAHSSEKKEDAKEKSPRQSVVMPKLEGDEEAKMHEWLNVPFSIARGVAYFVIFGLLVFVMVNKYGMTAEHDANLDAARLARNKQKYVASIGLFLFAIFLTLMATDWVMSLEETFASSMFPVIVFDNAAITAYCVGLLTLLYLKEKGHPRFVNLFPAGEQIHLGSLLLAFTLAWTYFNFSQYMLIWIGNLPEEIPYYLKRTRGGWEYLAIGLVIFHFPIPFLLLLFRHVKSNPKALRAICIGLLCVCFIDVMWWISPTIHHEGSVYWLMDVAAWVGVGGIWLWFFLGQLKSQPLLPTRELYLLEAYHHGH